jgi:two-component system cell cycle response regulator
MLDIDDFKKFNDTRGHLAGDAMLKWLGQVIKKNIRDVDLPARYGGEEFVIVLPYADRETAEIVAKRIEDEIQYHPPLSKGFYEPGAVTVSMGIAFYPSEAASVDELIHMSDIALYRAKRAGKNRICMLDVGSFKKPPDSVSSIC